MDSFGNYVNRNKSVPFDGTDAGSPATFLESEKKRITEGAEIFKKELKANWQRRHAGEAIFPVSIARANLTVVKHLLSFDMVGKYDVIAKEGGLDGRQRNALPQIVWQCFLEGRLQNVSEELIRRLSVKKEDTESFIRIVNEKILREIEKLNSQKVPSDPSGSFSVVRETAKEKQNVIKKNLQRALQEYPKLGDQLISSVPLRLRVFPELVRPSIKNWIADYHDSLGVGKHGTIERGDFLFHSENGKKLSSLERRKLAEVLKSLDEDSEINVDPQNEVVVFETSNQPQIQQQPKMQAFPQKTSEARLEWPEKKETFPEKRESDYTERLKTPMPAQKNYGIREVKDFKKKDGQIANVAGINSSKPDFGDKGRMTSQEIEYDFMKSKSLPQEDFPKKMWNPAQAVRQKMKDEGVTSDDQKIRFSSAQVLPSEKEQISASQQTHKSDMTINSRISASEVSSDDLMERLKKMNKNQAADINAKKIFKIVPTNISEKDEGDFGGGDAGADSVVRGNVVDLRQ